MSPKPHRLNITEQFPHRMSIIPCNVSCPEMSMFCLHPDCGGNISISDVKTTDLTLNPPGYPKAPQGNVVCVWIIEAPRESDNTSINVINYKYELNDYSTTST